MVFRKGPHVNSGVLKRKSYVNEASCFSSLLCSLLPWLYSNGQTNIRRCIYIHTFSQWYHPANFLVCLWDAGGAFRVTVEGAWIDARHRWWCANKINAVRRGECRDVTMNWQHSEGSGSAARFGCCLAAPLLKYMDTCMLKWIYVGM